MKIVTLLAAFFLQSSLWASEHDIDHLKEAKPFVTPNVLVAWDNDNTLTKPVQVLGSDQWFIYLIKLNAAAGMDDKEALYSAVDSWVEVQQETKVVTVEPDTSDFVSNAQKVAKNMMLTARPKALQKATEEQLKSVGINMNANAPWPHDILLPGNRLYSRGILFMGPGHQKGETLLAFLKATGLKFEGYVFIDDTKKNDDSVEESLERANLKIDTFVYHAEDANVRTFDPRLADREAGVFFTSGAVISDGLAKKPNVIEGLKAQK